MLSYNVFLNLFLVQPEVGIVSREKMDLTIDGQLADFDVDALGVHLRPDVRHLLVLCLDVNEVVHAGTLWISQINDSLFR